VDLLAGCGLRCWESGFECRYVEQDVWHDAQLKEAGVGFSKAMTRELR
jgi:hypothetical protein